MFDVPSREAGVGRTADLRVLVLVGRRVSAAPEGQSAVATQLLAGGRPRHAVVEAVAGVAGVFAVVGPRAIGIVVRGDDRDVVADSRFWYCLSQD